MKYAICVIGWFIILTVFAFRQYVFGGLIPIQFNLLPAFYSPWKYEVWSGYERGVPNKPIGTDNPKLFYPYRKFATEAFKQGRVPLWNPYVFSGNVHAATYQSAVWYPLNFLYFIFPQADAWSMLILLQPILIGWFTFLFIRSQGLSRRASLFGSMAFAFSGWMIAWWEESIVIVHSILWLPLALYASTRKRWFLLVVALSMSILAGFLQMSIYVFAVVMVWNICFGRKIKFLALAFFAALLITAIQWLPATEAYFSSPRGTVAATFLFEQYLVPIRHLITLIAPDFWGNPGSYNYFFPKLFYHEKVIWIGLFPLIFAILGAGFRRDRHIKFWTAFTLIVLSLGFAFPTSWVWYVLRVPVLSAAQPARIFVLFAFGASVLAAYGMEAWIAARIPKKLAIFVLTILLIVLTALWGFVLIARWRVAYSATLSLQDLERYGRYATVSFRNLFVPTLSLFVAWVVFLFIKNKKLVFGVVTVATVAWSLYAADKFLYFSDRRFEFPEIPAITKLKELTSKDYSRVWGYGDASFTPNMLSYYGLFSSEGYDALFSQRYGELLHVIKSGGKVSDQIDRTDAILKGLTERDPMDQSPARLRLMSLLGVRYILEYRKAEYKDALTDDTRFPPALFTIVWEDNLWRIWEYKKALPRAWFATDIRVEKDPQRLVGVILNSQTDLQTTAIVEEMPEVIRPPLEKIHTDVFIRRYDRAIIELDVSSPTPGLVVLSDTYFPGWVARVDGKLSKIYRADYALRGIPVESGRHTVVLTYEPVSFRFGVWGSLGGVLACIIFLIFLARQNQQRIEVPQVLRHLREHPR